MKKALLIVLLISLLMFEIYLCAVFLPLQWQHELNTVIVRFLPETHDWTPVTHPMLEQEIEGVLHEHLWMSVCLYGITLLLLAVNAWAIYRIVQLVRSDRYAR
jgi:hypothetical protein